MSRTNTDSAGNPFISVVCTDRGQHPWLTLGDISVTLGLLDVNTHYAYGPIAERLKAESVRLVGKDRRATQLHMRCPRCKRHVKWSNGNATERIRKMADAGVSSLDISGLSIP